MSEAQAGTQATPTPENSNAGQGGAADGSGLNAQQQKEWMTLKQKAEEFNRVAEEKKALELRLAQMEQLVSRGNVQATDPQADLVNRLREQAQYDDVAKATLLNMEMTARAQAEAWLAQQLVSVPEVKRERVAGLVRSSNYQMGVDTALNMVTDPEVKSYEERLREAEETITRLKGAKHNGSSPSATTPATASADESGSQSEMKRSDYIAALKNGAPNAKELMRAAGSGKLKLVDE